jgi:hypothetical protein
LFIILELQFFSRRFMFLISYHIYFPVDVEG